MDIQKFRQSKRDEFERVAKIIDENFDSFCEVAKELKNGTLIETPYGNFTFQPDMSFAYTYKKSE